MDCRRAVWPRSCAGPSSLSGIFVVAAALKNRQQRYQQGRDLRTRTPREAHAEFHGPRDRDAVAILAESDAERVPNSCLSVTSE